jgi:hypothetical protein
VRFVRETIRKARDLATHLDVRIDAGLVEGKVLDAIDDEGASFVGRIKNNAVLDKLAEPLLYRPPGRPSKAGEQFAVDVGTYQAARWTRPYRLVLVVTDLPDPKTGLRALWGRLLERLQGWWLDAAWGRNTAARRHGPRPRRWVAPPSHAHLSLVLRE